MKVLSVDDSETVRRTIQNMLEVLGLEFAEAADGQDALNLLKSGKQRVDLILLDWEMPVMNGETFLKTIKQDKELASIPVIMVTTVSQKEKVIDAIRAGAKHYITKPFSVEDLLTKIMQTLGIANLDDYGLDVL